MKDLNALRNEAFEREGTRFPAKLYKELVLGPAFDETKTHYLYPMRSINLAHVIMLAEEKLIPDELASRILSAVLNVDYEGFKDRPYTGRYEDLYFEVEAEIIERVGPEGGFVHLARSRNDIGITLQRMMLRQHLLGVIGSLSRLMEAVAAFADAHKKTLTIAHTHTQQAQPTRMGHYFLGVLDLLNRDMARMQGAYARTNVSPMGAAAITTSGFKINRFRVAELLGFDRPIENSYDAISGFDYAGEIAVLLGLCAVNLSKPVTDMMAWATQEYGVIKLQDAYVQTSSIMPQKRNPSALEHTRAILSTVAGCPGTVLGTMHNTPYGDIADSEDDVNPFLLEMMRRLTAAMDLLAAVITTMEVNDALLAERANDSFSSITELADTLVRETGMSFRQTHSVAAHLVKRCVQNDVPLSGVTPAMIGDAYAEVVGQRLAVNDEVLARCLSPEHFVDIRDVYGGTSQAQISAMLDSADGKLTVSAAWLDGAKRQLANAEARTESIARERASVK